MLKKIMTLIVTFPLLVMADEEPPNIDSQTITVRGSVYRACTVSWPQELNMGDHKASRWLNNDQYLLPAGNIPEAVITLSECEPGTSVRISARGQGPEDYPHYMKNTLSEQRLMANLDMYHEAGQQWRTLRMTNDNYVDAFTISDDSTATRSIRLRAVFRRTDTSVRPVGAFRATPTVIITFL
jgi:hypothetical protein